MESLANALGYLVVIFIDILLSSGWVLLMIAWGLVVVAILITMGVGLKKLWQARK